MHSVAGLWQEQRRRHIEWHLTAAGSHAKEKRVIQIIFGWVGFHCAGGKCRGMANDVHANAKVYVLCIGVVSFLFWNLAGMRLFRRVLHMSVTDMALITKRDEFINERVETAVKFNNEIQQERIDYWRNHHFEYKNESALVISAAKARITDLEATVRTLSRIGKASNV